MLLKRDKALEVQKFFNLIKNKKFSIHTQYKLIKIKKALEEEQNIYQEQIKLNCSQYFETDEQGSPIINEQGGYKIKSNKMNECYLVLDEINKCEVQLPDIYFSLEELEELDLTFEELEVLNPFIK
jgi:hypothetical protein